jgi:hypothetical protein
MADLVAFIDSAIEQCKTPFDIERKKHELSGGTFVCVALAVTKGG